MADKKLTREDILQAEHDLIGGGMVWECDTQEQVAGTAFYTEGAHDMADRILMLLDRIETTEDNKCF